MTTAEFSRKYQRVLSSSEWFRLKCQVIVRCKGKCEGCGRYWPNGLELHHLHYDSLGHETMDDVRALCCDCHSDADAFRDEETRRRRWRRHAARVEAWRRGQARRGRYLTFDEAEDDFEHFLESKS